MSSNNFEEPVVSNETTREDIPLRTGARSKNWFNCNEECLGGSKFINGAFATLTVVITVALLVQIYYGDYQVIPHGSVATDSLECSKIGTLILKNGGNSVDATIASAFCLAVVTPHLTGLDAEGQLLIYNHRIRNLPEVIDFSASTVVSENLPKLVLGLAYTHKQYGTLPWKDLVMPAANLASQGFLIPKMLVQAITNTGSEDLYGRLEPGQILKLEHLGATLTNLANTPEKELYGYIKTTNQPVHSQSLKSKFNNYDIFVPNSPSIGPPLLKNLEQIEMHNFTTEDVKKPEYLYRIADITQSLYEDLNISSKFHLGTTSNVAAIDLNDNYVSLVTGMYKTFGSGEMTDAGYVLNVKSNDIPCSRLPIIIIDGSYICGRRMIFGASDISVAAQLVTALLIANQDVTDTIEAPRFHLLNASIGIEDSHSPTFSDEVLKYLETLTSKPIKVLEPYASSNIVEKVKDDLSSHSDSRGGGIASRF